MREVLAINTSTSHETVREDLHAIVESMEKALQEKRQPDPVKLERDPALAVPNRS